jgi:hypothetical protein
MDRRRFIMAAGASALAGPASAALPVPAGNEIGFKVLRNGSIVGEHHIKFTESGDQLTAQINFGLVVTFAGITLYRYAGQATEIWSGDVFQSVQSAVNNNGTLLEVHAHKTAAGYDVVGVNHNNPAKSYPEYTAPPDTLPLTYWNKQILSATLLNIQTAHSYKPIVNSPGWNQLPTANGGTLTAQRFDLTGKLQLSVWYDINDQWSGLEFHVSGDETYQKITA